MYIRVRCQITFTSKRIFPKAIEDLAFLFFLPAHSFSLFMRKPKTFLKFVVTGIVVITIFIYTWCGNRGEESGAHGRKIRCCVTVYVWEGARKGGGQGGKWVGGKESKVKQWEGRLSELQWLLFFYHKQTNRSPKTHRNSCLSSFILICFLFNFP